MDFVTFLFVAIFVMAAFAAVVFFSIWFWLAPNNYFFTFVKEGTAKVVVRAGKFKKALMSWEGRAFDKDWNVVKGKENGFWSHFGGLRWVGIYPFDKIYAYKFRWVTLDDKGNLEAHEERWQDYVLLEDDYYAFKIEKAEDKNSIPLDLTMIMTVAPRNLYKWLFNVEDALEMVIARTGPAVRDIIGEYSYEEMIRGQEKKKNDDCQAGEKFELDKTFMKILETRKFFDQFSEYGANIKALQAKEIDPPDSYRTATLTKRTSEYTAEGINIIAEAESGRIEKVYSKILGFGEDGKFIRMFEAVEKSPLASSLVVVPGLSQMVDNVISAKGGKKVVAKNKENAGKEIKMLEKEKENKKEAA